MMFDLKSYTKDFLFQVRIMNCSYESDLFNESVEPDLTKRMVHEPVVQKNREQISRTCPIRSGPDYLEGILCIVVLLSHIVILFV